MTLECLAMVNHYMQNIQRPNLRFNLKLNWQAININIILYN